MRAPRRRACSSSSSSIAPPPSLSTKPSRSLSHGRLASAGASLRVESAFAGPRPPSPQRVVAISPPPAIIRSASPYWMVRMPKPMACVEGVQAVHTPALRAFRPQRSGTGGDEERRDLARTHRLQVLAVFGLDGPQATDAGAAHRAAALRIGLGEVDTGVAHGLHPGGDA